MKEGMLISPDILSCLTVVAMVMKIPALLLFGLVCTTMGEFLNSLFLRAVLVNVRSGRGLVGLPGVGQEVN